MEVEEGKRIRRYAVTDLFVLYPGKHKQLSIGLSRGTVNPRLKGVVNDELDIS